MPFSPTSRLVFDSTGEVGGHLAGHIPCSFVSNGKVGSHLAGHTPCSFEHPGADVFTYFFESNRD